jgi:hypothetical protein
MIREITLHHRAKLRSRFSLLRCGGSGFKNASAGHLGVPALTEAASRGEQTRGALRLLIGSLLSPSIVHCQFELVPHL